MYLIIIGHDQHALNQRRNTVLVCCVIILSLSAKTTKIKHMKIVYTMVWPVLIDIKWTPIKLQTLIIINFL